MDGALYPVGFPTTADPLKDCCYLHGVPAATGQIRSSAEDFRVDEVMGFSLDGQGEHLWLRLEKVLLNTTDVVARLSKATSVPARDIGISGLKDRNAVTTQWFSLPAGSDVDSRHERIASLCADDPNLQLITIDRHQGKLRRGSHRLNRFSVVVRNLHGNQPDLADRLQRITERGVPNYFGPQRFGRGGKNLQTAERLFSGQLTKLNRVARGMALSSARSYIFNQVLSERISRWGIDSAQIGDALQLDGTKAFFLHDGSDARVVDRIAAHDVHPTGPLWGDGEPPVGRNVAEFELSVASRYPLFCTGLVEAGLKHQRRALRVVPSDLTSSWKNPATLELGFTLPAGAFATAVLRELVII